MPLPTERASEVCPHYDETSAWYEVRTDAPSRTKRACARCALLNAPLLWRSARVASVVGTLLVLLNQSDKLFGEGALPADLWWRIPLTYCVPFAVATYGALSNGRRAPTGEAVS